MKYSNIAFPQDLEVRIVSRIHIVEKRAKTRRFIGLGSLSAVSFGGIVFMGIYLGNAMNDAGVTQYASVVISDSSAFGTYWRDLTLTILDSLPILGVTVLLAAVGVFMWSGSKVLQNKSNRTVWSSI